MKLTKKEKIIIACSVTVICFSLYTFNKRDILIEKLANSQILSKSYQESKEKRVIREIDRKINSHTLKEDIKGLSLEKLEVMNDILDNEDFLKVLNSKDKKSYSSEKYLSGDISYDEATLLYNASKGFREFSLLSDKIKNYLTNSFPNLDYNKVVDNEGKVAELILSKDKFLKLTSNKELKEIIRSLNKEQLDKLNAIIGNNSDILEFLNFNEEFLKQVQENSNKLLTSGLPFETLEKFVTLSKKMDELSHLDEGFKNFIGKNMPGIEFKKIYLYGGFYLADKNSNIELEKEYRKKVYSFDNPYIKLNPYGRTPLTALVKVDDSLAGKKIKITIFGEFGSGNYTYNTTINKLGELPIVGLYPKSENKIALELEDGRRKNISIVTGQLDDILPAIVIEKKIPERMEKGMNLVSFNTKDRAMPFVFDINGNIRYVLDISSTINKAYVGKEGEDWIVANNEAVFTFDILGKVLSTREPKYYAENENWKNGVLFREVQYLPKMNNQLAVYGFSDKVIYPSGVFSELGIDSKQELFKARLYFDKNNFEENNILSGRRIELF